MEAIGRDAQECALLPTFLSHVDCGRTPERKMEHKGVTIYRDEKTAGRPNKSRIDAA